MRLLQGSKQRSIQFSGWLGIWLLILLPTVAQGQTKVWTQLLHTGQTDVMAIVVDPTDSLTINAATFGQGILAAVDVQPLPPKRGLQLRIRGNPAIGQATHGLGFDTLRDSRVTVRVYDVGGALVATLINRELGAGGHQVTWRGRDATDRAVASGIYFAEVVVGTERAVAKLIRLR